MLSLCTATSWVCAATIPSIQSLLTSHDYAFVPATEMQELLSTEFGGVHDEDMTTLATMWDQATPQIDEQGMAVYPYKGTFVSYYRLKAGHVHRSSSHDWPKTHILNTTASHVVEHIDPTTADDSVSHFRLHRQWPPAMDNNSVVLAMQRLMFRLAQDPSLQLDKSHQHLGEETPLISSPFEAMMTAYRVTKCQVGVCRDGDPGPEGIHQDAAELTAVVLFGRRNVAALSGGNRVWSLEQPFGKPSEADTTSGRLLASLVMRERFDTLLVRDRRVKHEALPIVSADATGDAVRDVWTFEVRLPRDAPPDGTSCTES